MFAYGVARAARIAQGISPAVIAVACGVTERQIHRYEAGKNEPAYSVGVQMERALGLDCYSLYAHEPDASEATNGRGRDGSARSAVSTS
jgi:transcriptional regulator with XRE-family HTH domain